MRNIYVALLVLMHSVVASNEIVRIGEYCALVDGAGVNKSIAEAYADTKEGETCRFQYSPSVGLQLESPSIRRCATWTEVLGNLVGFPLRQAGLTIYTQS